MRVLIISAEVWRDDTNGGNVLSNIFTGLNAEFAQIYCNPGAPSNNFCKKYFQFTDSMIIKNIFLKHNNGKILKYTDYPNGTRELDGAIQPNEKFYKVFRKFSFPVFHMMKEILWSISSWQSNELDQFITEFAPDIVFAPCYGSQFMLSLDRYVANLIQKPMVSYISDDHYTLKQYSLSPFYWLNRFTLRRNLRKTFHKYDLVYTMTDEQLNEYSSVFNTKMKILRKGADLETIQKKTMVTNPIKLIYAGGIYAGRWKTLVEITKALKEINKDSVKMVLEIYTGNELIKDQQELLNDRINSFVNGLITQEELRKKYSECDIALHVEAFDLKYRLLTRLSFSTKIVDCLSSGCAVMVISWEKHSGYKYLEKEDAAICINDSNKIHENLVRIVENPDIIRQYSEKAYMTCRKNHKKSEIKKMIESDFKEIIREISDYDSTTN